MIELTGDPAKVLSIADSSAAQNGAQWSAVPDEHPPAYAAAVELYEREAFELPVERTFSLLDAAKAQRASEAGHARGRIVVTLSP